jgi:hypothetical protein
MSGWHVTERGGKPIIAAQTIPSETKILIDMTQLQAAAILGLPPTSPRHRHLAAVRLRCGILRSGADAT